MLLDAPRAIPTSLRQRCRTLDRWLVAAAFVWAVMTIALCTRSALTPHKQNLFGVWKLAGSDWLTGHDLYQADHPLRLNYRYGPIIAAAFTVWEVVPERLGNVVWRLLNAGVFLAAFSWWLRRGISLETTVRQRAICYLLAAPLALGSLNNGQPNPLVIGLMLAGVTAVVERWTLAAGCLALAVLFKLYPIALVLLLCIAFPRRLPVRFLIALAILLAAPFLLQHADYVQQQYRLWYERVGHGDVNRRFWPPRYGYRDLWMLLRIWQVPISLPLYTILQLAGGACCGLLALAIIARRWVARERATVVLTLAIAWMMLLGPSTESSTFVMIAPVLVFWIVQARLEQRWAAHYLAVMGWGLLVGCVIAGSSSHGIDVYQAAGLQPLGVLLGAAGYLAVLIQRLLTRGPARASTVAEEPPLVRAA